MRTGSAAEDGQRRVDPFVLPRSSTSRFTLLVLIVAAASVFASYWLLILQQNSWRDANVTCVARADAVTANPVASAHVLVSCVHDVVVRQYLTILVGPLVLASLTVAGLVVIPRLILIWLQTSGLRAEDARTRDQLHAAVTVMGLRRVPEFLWAGRGGLDRAEVRTIDGLHRPRVVIDNAAAPSTQTFRAMILHELAHLRNHDVRPTFVVLSAWSAYLAAVAIPLTVLALSRRSDVGFALTWRLAVITLVVYLVLMSALRTREHEADLRVMSVTGGEEITAALALSSADPPQTGWRNRLHAPFRRHPLLDMRRRVLTRPDMIMKASGAEAFSTGVAGGLVITEAELLVEYLTPVSPLTSCWITGLVCAAAILSVVGASLWRATLAAAVLTDPPPRAWWPGCAVAAGLMAGIQLSPRSAADWVSVFATASAGVGSTSLGSAALGAVLLFALLLVLVCSALTAWMTLCATVWLDTTRTTSTTRVWAACSILGSITFAVPLGTCWYFYRLAAATTWSPTAVLAQLAAVPTLWAALASSVLAVAVVAVGAVRNGRFHARRRLAAPEAAIGPLPRVRPLRALATGIAVVLAVMAAPFAAHAVTPVSVVPAKYFTLPPSHQAGFACIWFERTDAQTFFHPLDTGLQQSVGRYLSSTDDQQVRQAGALLLQSVSDHIPELVPRAGQVMKDTCELLLRYGRNPTTR